MHTDGADDNGLGGVARRVADLVMWHAEVAERAVFSTQEYARVTAELHEVTLQYSELIEAQLGRGDPFAGDVDLLEEEDEENDVSVTVPRGTKLTLQARYDVVITEPDAFITFAETKNQGTPLREYSPSGALEAALVALFLADGWDPAQYEAHGVSPAGDGYWVERTQRTLFEMTLSERDEIGF